MSHHPGGPLKALTFGNGLTLSQTVNRRHEPVAISSGPLALGYTVSPAGDVTRIADESLTLSGCPRSTWRDFRYDFLDRLTESPGWLAYGHDGAGNRTSESVGNVQAVYSYGTSLRDRVQYRSVGGKRTHAFGYDALGALSAVGQYDASGTSQTAAVCFRHDALGRMVLYGRRSPGFAPGATTCTQDAEVSQPLARFKYDARNRRIARQDAASGQWTYVVSDSSGNPLSELALVSGAWQQVRDYVWLDGRPLAQIEYPGPSGSSEGYPYFFHLDHIGLPRAITNANGQLVWNTFPRPYGDLDEKTTVDPLSGRPVMTNLRLPGQYDERLLPAAGIDMQGPYYNWNRWYLPGVGRYLELDPLALNGQANGRFGSDWYNYGNSSPFRYIDLWGLYGTNDCSYYRQRCAESGGKYYCEQAPYWCNWFDHDDPDPDPSRDDDFEGWTRRTRQCLQDCDRDENKNQNACPITPDPRKGPWDPRSKSFECHKKCYTHCKLWEWERRNEPPY